MKSRAAIDITYGEPLVVDDIEIPDPQPDQVIVKLMSSGVCHSQLHQIHGANAKRPAVMGHEGTGVVTHVGARRNARQRGRPRHRNLGSPHAGAGKRPPRDLAHRRDLSRRGLERRRVHLERRRADIRRASCANRQGTSHRRKLHRRLRCAHRRRRGHEHRQSAPRRFRCRLRRGRRGDVRHSDGLDSWCLSLDRR